MSEYRRIIQCVEEHFDNRFTFISTSFLHSHAPTYKNSEFYTKMEMVLVDNFDNQTHKIKIRYKTNKILINKINKIIRDKRGGVIDNVIEENE